MPFLRSSRDYRFRVAPGARWQPDGTRARFLCERRDGPHLVGLDSRNGPVIDRTRIRCANRPRRHFRERRLAGRWFHRAGV